MLPPAVRSWIRQRAAAGRTPPQILEELKKKDSTWKGKGGNPSLRTVQREVLAQRTGKPQPAPQKGAGAKRGRPVGRTVPPKVAAAMVKFVKDYRGYINVTSGVIQHQVPGAAAFSTKTILRVLRDRGLEYRLRRQKGWISPDIAKDRLAFARRVLKWNRRHERSIMFVDGAAFNQPVTKHQKKEQGRKNLGRRVLRTRKEGLHRDCVGASKFVGQGRSAKVWGAVVGGRLHVHVLKEGVSMNSALYARLINTVFPKWWKKSRPRGATKMPRILQDNERCLWSQQAKDAFHKQDYRLVVRYPTWSGDLNPIEQCWNGLRLMLGSHVPAERESRRAYLRRLHNTVAKYNTKYSGFLQQICGGNEMRRRAADVIAAKGQKTEN